MSPTEHFDCVVIGTGPGGRAVAPALAAKGLTVAAVEGELVGGECPFWACIPSKALLRAPQWKTDGAHVAGAAAEALDWPAIREYRDYMNSGLDDTAKAEWIESTGVTLVRGSATVPERGVVLVDDRRLETDHIVIATGTGALIPPIEGLQREHAWTNRELTSLREVPESAVIIGGGPVGVEGAQFLAGLGCQVTLIVSGERPIEHETTAVGELAQRALEARGVVVRTEAKAVRVEHGEGSTRVEFEQGEPVEAAQLVLATGRVPNTGGVMAPDVSIDDHGIIAVDERCQAAPGIWAVGDVTGVAQFTHVASYQGRVVADNILGTEHSADYRGVPRVVFAEPEIAGVGLTAAQARDQGLDVREVTVDLGDTDRTETYGRDLFGGAGLVVDTARDLVVGAWAVGPEAGEWIHYPALAIRAEVPVGVLADTAQQFPTFSELWGTAAQQYAAG